MLKLPKEIVHVNVGQIIVDKGRARINFDSDKLLALSKSIKDNGLVQPIVCNKAEGEEKYHLVAGERRFRACMMAGVSIIPIILHKDMTPLEQKVMELEENMAREDLKWDEQLSLTAQIHKLKLEQFGPSGQGLSGGWRVEDTASLLGENKSTTAAKLRLHEALEKRPELKEKVKNLDEQSAKRVVKEAMALEDIAKLKAAGKLKISTSLTNLSCLDDVKTKANESIDCVIADLPYGADDINNPVREAGSQTYLSVVKSTDNMTISDLEPLLGKLIPELYRVMKPGAHLWFFYGIDCHHFLQTQLRTAGFDVVNVPIIWDKGRSTATFRGYEPLPCYENIMLAHRGPRKRRLTKSMKMILSGYDPVPSGIRVHPFEKPSKLLAFLIEQSTREGELVYDPFAGSASTLVTALQLGRSVTGCEIDPDRYAFAQMKLQKELEKNEGVK